MLSRKMLYGIAAGVAIPIVLIAALGIALLGHANELPWQAKPTRIPVTPFGNLPGSTALPTATTSGPSGFSARTFSFAPANDTGERALAQSSGDYPDYGTTSPTQTPPAAASTAPAGTPIALPAGSTVYTVDATKSEAKISVRQKLTALPDPNDAVLTTRAFRGQLALGPDGRPVAGTTIQVDLRTLKSDEPDRDNYIRGHTLNSDTFPVAQLTVSKFDQIKAPLKDGQQATFQIDGNLTIHGVTKPVTFQTTATRSGKTVNGTATTTLSFHDFGMKPPEIAGFVKAGDIIKLEVTITATAP